MPSGYAYLKEHMARLGRKGGAAGRGSLARKLAASKAAKVRWGHTDITSSPNSMKFKCQHCGKQNSINIGKVLGSRTSEAKADAARLNALMPPKPGSRPRGRPRKKPVKAPEMITPPIPAPPVSRKKSGSREAAPKPSDS